MAYTFNAISNMLGQENEDGKQNIFNQGSGGGSDQGGGSSPQSSQTVEKDVGGGALGSQNQGQAQPGMQQGKPKGNSAQAIMQKAQKSNMDTSKFTEGIQSNIAQNQKKLEDDASSFVQNQTGRARQGVSAENVRAAAQGDADAYSRVENTIRGPGTRAENFQFAGNNNFQDLDNMSTQSGLQASLSKKGPAMYNQGQAALDSMLISKDKNYQKNLLEAKKQRDALKSRQAEIEGGAMQQQAQSQIDAIENQARQDALAQLTGYRGELDRGVDTRMGNYYNYLEQARLRGGGELSSLENELRNEIARENSALSDFAKQADVDEGGYLRLNSNQRGRDDFYTSDIAQQYNRLQDLLGVGGKRYTGIDNLGAYSSYDREKMKQDLLNQANKLKAEKEAKPINANTGTLSSLSNKGGGFIGQTMKKIFGK